METLEQLEKNWRKATKKPGNERYAAFKKFMAKMKEEDPEVFKKFIADKLSRD
jgi:predicted solute-binding protein